jgi:hypothetical protein
MEKRFAPSNDPSNREASDTDDSKGINKPSIPDQPSDSSIEKATADDEDYKYVTGFKLVIVMISVTLVGFLVMLDTSIISTVRLSLAHSLPQ